MKTSRGNILELNSIIMNVKVGSLRTEDIFSLLKNKIELKKISEEIFAGLDIAKKDIPNKNEQNEFIQKYLQEEIECKLEKIDEEKLVEMARTNDMTIGQIEILNVLS